MPYTCPKTMNSNEYKITLYDQRGERWKPGKLTDYKPKSLNYVESEIIRLWKENPNYYIIGIKYNDGGLQFMITGTYKNNESDKDVIKREIQEEIGLTPINIDETKIKHVMIKSIKHNKLLLTEWCLYSSKIVDYKISTIEDFDKYDNREAYNKKINIIIYGTKEEIENKIKNIKYLMISNERITGYCIVPISLVYIYILYYIKSFNNIIYKKILEKYIKLAENKMINNKLILYDPNKNRYASTWYDRNYSDYVIENNIYNLIIETQFNL